MTSVFLSFIKLNSFSGQTGATLQIESLLQDTKFKFKYLYLFPLQRSGGNKFVGLTIWVLKTLLYSFQILNLLVTRDAILYINLGQSLSSFFRVLWWFIPLKFLRPKLKIVVSLHGNFFLNWDLNSREIFWFKKIINDAHILTVLSERHKTHLRQIGIESNVDIRVVYNTNDNKSLTIDEINAKLHTKRESIQLLFLSLLIETKGYIEYLEAMKLIAAKPHQTPIEAILCGPINISRYCTKFKNAEMATIWIHSMVEEINSINPTQFKIKWIQGAFGNEKDQLFFDADIFIFPSRYPNESMPLVLLEAMSSGCAIISSNVGEINKILDNETALIEEILLTDKIVEHCEKFISQPDLRNEIALKAYNKVLTQFSAKNYKNNWIEIFNDLKQ